MLDRMKLTALVVGAVALVASGVGLGESLHEDKTPQVCLEALTGAQEVVGLLGEITSMTPDVVQAAFDHDATAIRAGHAKLEGINDRMDAASGPAMAAMAECRAKGE